ncbi:MAG TPA: hypothetical protein VFV87_10435, partial [Pirellulaceae bacterium]|nr:hypothetical protein [Pirellulaceae bacterium]
MNPPTRVVFYQQGFLILTPLIICPSFTTRAKETIMLGPAVAFVLQAATLVSGAQTYEQAYED